MTLMKEIVKKGTDSRYRVGNGYRLCILGDLNGWIGDRTRAGITGAIQFPEELWSSVLQGDCV